MTTSKSSDPAADERGSSETRRIKSGFGLALSAFACLLTVLTFVSFMPVPPSPELDPSWRYGVDQASAHHMPFGKALVFTAGPLVALYTDFRVPEHDATYLTFGIILALGIFAAFFLAADRRQRAGLLLLPLIVSNLLMKDAVLFVLPLALCLAACRPRWQGWTWHATFAVAAIADALLPLIKGTAIVPMVGCMVLSCTVLLGNRSPWWFLLPAVTVVSSITAWLVVGQSLLGVPAYLGNLFRIADGYTDAMSTYDTMRGPLIFVATALVLASLFAFVDRRRRLIRVLAIVSIAFVTFKAGFVRQDIHAVIPATFIALLGLLLLLQDPSWRGYAGLGVGLVGTVLIAGPYMPTDAATLLSQFTTRTTDSLTAISRHLTHPDRTFAAFRQGKTRLQINAGLPHLGGTVDVYPIDIATLLASDLDWDPRPVPQSYSAYTPALSSRNAQHLEGSSAPDDILFDVKAIDGRYPSLEDGASWLGLLSHYDFRSSSPPYALLHHSIVDYHATVGAPFAIDHSVFDTDIPLPTQVPHVWASLSFHPSLAGRLASIAFKRPPLLLIVTLASGDQETFRLIPGMADGFLLSPLIRSPRDFVALSSGNPDVLTSSMVRSFRVHEASRHAFWGPTFDAILAPLTFAPHPVNEQEIYGTSTKGAPLSTMVSGGECAIDSIDGRSVGSVPQTLDGASATVEGWGMMSSRQKIESGRVQVAITDRNGQTVYSDAAKKRRPDVNQYFELPDDAAVGYSAKVDLRPLPSGTYTVNIVQQGKDGRVACSSPSGVFRR